MFIYRKYSAIIIKACRTKYTIIGERSITPPIGGITFLTGAKTGSVALKTNNLKRKSLSGTKLNNILVNNSNINILLKIFKKFKINSLTILDPRTNL